MYECVQNTSTVCVQKLVLKISGFGHFSPPDFLGQST